MQHTTNYVNTFIEVAEDCYAEQGNEPPLKGPKSAARLQYESLIAHPYTLTSDELLFSLYSLKNNILHKQQPLEREAFFSRGQPCMRASDLPKKYGWGIHCDGNARMAIYGVETEAYAAFKANPALAHSKAMRSVHK